MAGAHMAEGKKHKVIITGTGRAGTTLLVQLLTELGLDTGYTPEHWPRDYHAHCSAGLEHDIEDPTAPYIVKNPALCETLSDVLARGRITIDFAFIPIRRLEDAALSRVRVGGDGRTPGGLTGTTDPAKQREVLAANFHRLVETLCAHDIPHSFLHFPRFAHDARYTYEKLQPVLGSISREHFDRCFAHLARPELIHSFAAGAPADAGAPARAFKASRRVKRLLRHSLRLAAGLALIGSGWMASNWLGDNPPAVSDPAPLAQENHPHAPKADRLYFGPLSAFRPPPFAHRFPFNGSPPRGGPRFPPSSFAPNWLSGPNSQPASPSGAGDLLEDFYFRR